MTQASDAPPNAGFIDHDIDTHADNQAVFFATLLLAASGLATPAHAQITNLNLPISLDADSTDYDGKNSMLLFEGLRLTQGTIGVQADKGLASKLDFEDAVWQFSGNVSSTPRTGASSVNPPTSSSQATSSNWRPSGDTGKLRTRRPAAKTQPTRRPAA